MLNIDNITYSIGQVAEIADVSQSTLRYWETVFYALKPKTTPGGSRRYSRDDIELISTIKDLLYNQGYTIKGANQFIRNLKKVNETVNPEQKEIQNKVEIEKNAGFLSIEFDMKSLLRKLENIKKILE